MSSISEYLFKTDAVKICPENQPFWYTSGKIGPYYINAHFIYGDETQANNLLSIIDKTQDKEELPKIILAEELAHYNERRIYKDVIDQTVEFVKSNINLDEIDYISGGERRDWFFSNILAYMLEKPHISIFKDLSSVIHDSSFSKTLDITDLGGAKVLHVADLITEAVSYTRAWVPAIKSLNGQMTHSVAMVDRLQGGAEALAGEGVMALAIVNIDRNLFLKALEMSVINNEQLNMLNDYTSDPDGTMKKFIEAHPEFLETALKADEKTAARAQLCIDSKFYE